MFKFKSLKDYVYEYISAEISEGNLGPEEKINEAFICEKLSISRTPVREALIQLTSDGILRNVPRKGFVVKTLTDKEAEDLYVIIGNLDGLAAQLAYPNLTEQDYNDMAFHISSMDAAITSRNYEMYATQQKAFHQVYIDKCGNEALIEYLEKMKSKFLKAKYNDQTDEDVMDALKATNEEHQQILNLLKEGKLAQTALYLSDVHWSRKYAHFDSLNNMKA